MSGIKNKNETSLIIVYVLCYDLLQTPFPE